MSKQKQTTPMNEAGYWTRYRIEQLEARLGDMTQGVGMMQEVVTTVKKDTEMTTEHPWQTAKEDFDFNVLPILKKRGAAIGEAAKSGDEKAKRVISLYTMLHRSFDPVTLIALKDAMGELPS